MPKKLTQLEYIKKVKECHGDNLSFDKTVYKNSRANVLVECKIHGEFSINARGLQKGIGCKECNFNWKSYVQRQRMTTEEFVKKAINKHEEYYSYEKSNYINSRSKITIICPIHGDFEYIFCIITKKNFIKSALLQKKILKKE